MITSCLIRRVRGVGRRLPLVFLLLPMLTCRADVAVLREKGPWSGSVFSNLGVVKGLDPETKVSMRKADVRIRLSRGPDDTLLAKCEADFELEDVTRATAGTQDFLVAFPVSGLDSRLVTVTGFSVLVDGQAPGVVLRRGIVVSKRESRLLDAVVAGQLDARFQLGRDAKGWGVTLADEGLYRSSYVWAQQTSPGKKTQVKVSYSVALQAQRVRYSKSTANDAADGEVIPFADLKIGNWNDEYYFFDYILTSGSTWDGPIGKETIEVSFDPALKMRAGAIHFMDRTPLARGQKPADRGKWAGSAMNDDEDRTYTVTGKPWHDVLLAIPKSAIGALSEEKSK